MIYHLTSTIGTNRPIEKAASVRLFLLRKYALFKKLKLGPSFLQISVVNFIFFTIYIMKGFYAGEEVKQN